MAAIEGFELAIATDDVTVADGLLDGDAVAGVTLDVSALGLGDGTHHIVVDADGTTVTGVDALAADQVKLGEFTEATGAATGVSLAGRGDTVDNTGISADEAHVA